MSGSYDAEFTLLPEEKMLEVVRIAARDSPDGIDVRRSQSMRQVGQERPVMSWWDVSVDGVSLETAQRLAEAAT